MTDFVSATKKIIKKRTLIRKRITIRINLLKNDESMNPIAFKKHEAEIDSFLTEIRALNSQIEDVCNTLDLDVEEELEKDITQECEFSIRIFNDLAILASNSEPEAKWLPDSKPTRSQSCENNEPSILRHYSVWTSKPITSKANNGKAELEKTSSKSEFQSAPKINKKNRETKPFKRKFSRSKSQNRLNEKKPNDRKNTLIRQKNVPNDKADSGSKKYRPKKRKNNYSKDASISPNNFQKSDKQYLEQFIQQTKTAGLQKFISSYYEYGAHPRIY